VNHTFGHPRRSRGGAPPAAQHDEGSRMLVSTKLQNKLIISGRFTHTLISDIDELIWPASKKYASLQDYLDRNRRRAMIATNGYSIYEAREEPPLDWKAVGMLQQRKYWRGECGMCKPALTRLPIDLSFSTHEVAQLPYSPCRRRPLDCVDVDLLLIHTKCIDVSLMTSREVRRHFSFSGMDDGGAIRKRCGVADRWLRGINLTESHSELSKTLVSDRLPHLPVERIPVGVKVADSQAAAASNG